MVFNNPEVTKGNTPRIRRCKTWNKFKEKFLGLINLEALPPFLALHFLNSSWKILELSLNEINLLMGIIYDGKFIESIKRLPFRSCGEHSWAHHQCHTNQAPGTKLKWIIVNITDTVLWTLLTLLWVAAIVTNKVLTAMTALYNDGCYMYRDVTSTVLVVRTDNNRRWQCSEAMEVKPSWQ